MASNWEKALPVLKGSWSALVRISLATAKEAPVAYQMVDRLIERDGVACWLCGKLVKLGVSPNHPLFPTADHVIARKDGGPRTFANLKLAHSHCNGKASLADRRQPYVSGSPGKRFQLALAGKI